jgi:hypothetical protein
VIVEEPEEAVQPHVHRRRLDHGAVERVQLDALGIEFGTDIAV